MAGATARGKLPKRPIKKWEIMQAAAVAEMRDLRMFAKHAWQVSSPKLPGPRGQSPLVMQIPPVSVGRKMQRGLA